MMLASTQPQSYSEIGETSSLGALPGKEPDLERRPSGSNVTGRLGAVFAKKIQTQFAAEDLADRLVDRLSKVDGWASEDLEFVLASVSVWLPQIAPRLREQWLRRPLSHSTFAAAKARRLLARWRFREIDPPELYASAEALFRELDAEESQPVSSVATLHVLFLAMRQVHMDLEDLPRGLQQNVQRAIALLLHHLSSGDYRKGSPFCASPELLLCMISEMWRETVALSFELRRPLELAIRWELQIEAAETPFSRAALMIASENLHLKGEDPREQRMDLIALQNPDGDFPRTLFKRPDGSIFAPGDILSLAFVARALAGQPRTGRI